MQSQLVFNVTVKHESHKAMLRRRRHFVGRLIIKSEAMAKSDDAKDLPGMYQRLEYLIY